MPYPSEPTKSITIGKIHTTTGRIYEYYQSVKKEIIKECDLRRVLLFNKYDNKDELVVVRKYKDYPIILNSDNFDDIITGYTISISVENEYPGRYLKQKLIDIDTRNLSIREIDLKNCVFDLYNFYKKFDCKITNSSTGYHFRVNINKQINYKVLASTFRELNDEFGKRYNINAKSNAKIPSDKINLDLSSMHNRGSLTVPYSLNRNLSICNYIDINKLNNFNRNTVFLK